MISEKAELSIGQETKKEIITEYGQYLNPKVQSYIREVGQRIVSVCDRKDISYEFVILDTPLVNAFAVPGVVFLTRGILQLIDDEAELATVIGHEVGHVTGYHTVKTIQKAFGYQFLSTLSTVAIALYGPSVDDPRAYAVIHQATQLVATGFLRGYGREFELEADRSGLRYAVLAGYDPDAMTSFFRRMGSLGEDEVSGIGLFLRTHPPTDVRIKEVKKILESSAGESSGKRKKNGFTISVSSAAQTQDRFENYQELMKELPESFPGAEGVIKKEEYFHPTLRLHLEVPSGWQLEASYSAQSLVRFYSKDHKAQGELKTISVALDPVLVKGNGTEIAGISQSTVTLSAEDWAERVEPLFKMEKRSGRLLVYPAGSSYIGTYIGRDRVGRPTFYKILYLLKGETREDQKAFLLSCAAPADSYFDYLVDFEKIMRSLEFY